MNWLISYFDLYAGHKDNRNKAHNSKGDEVGIGTQILIYLGCFGGILAGPYILAASKGSYPTLQQLFGGWPHFLWSIPIAFILTAGLFKLWLTPKTPLLAQIGIAIAVGAASGKLLPLALDALGG